VSALLSAPAHLGGGARFPGLVAAGTPFGLEVGAGAGQAHAGDGPALARRRVAVAASRHCLDAERRRVPAAIAAAAAVRH
jgi:hypothetical protein